MTRNEDNSFRGHLRLLGPGNNESAGLSLDTSRPGSEFAEEAVGNSGLLDVHRVMAHKTILLTCAFLGCVAGALWHRQETPVYQGTATLEISGLNENFMNKREVDPTAAGGNYFDDTYLQTQIRNLQSRTLVARVTKKIELAKIPEYRKLHLPLWARLLGLKPTTPDDSEQIIVNVAMNNLKVHPAGQTRIVEVSFDSPNRDIAAAFANTLCSEFIEQSLDSRGTITQQTSEWLGRQLGDLKVKLEESEQQLQAYARQSSLMYTSEHDNISEEKLRQLQTELSKASADRILKQSQAEMAKSNFAEALPDVIDNPVLRDYQSKLTEVRRQLAEARATVTKEHPRVLRLQAQITDLESAYEKYHLAIVSRIQHEFVSTGRRESLLQAAYNAQEKLVSDQAVKAIHYNFLKREADTNMQLYEDILQKVKNARIASAIRASNLRIVDLADVPLHPYSPRLSVYLGLGFLGGTLIGLCSAMAAKPKNGTIQVPGEMQTLMPVRELGVIPAADSDPDISESRGGLWAKLQYTPRAKYLELELGADPIVGSKQRVELISWQRKHSFLAEAFSGAVTSIMFSGSGRAHPRLIAVTSPEAGDGKTTVVSNLGITLTQAYRKVLVIDADMRNPHLHTVFDLPNSWGLSDLLSEDNPIETYPLDGLVRRSNIPGVYVLPSGPASVSIPQLLYSNRMTELLARVRREFDVVLIDTPPMLHLPDARILAHAVDGVVLVFRAGQTSPVSARLACEQFIADSTTVIGTLLNHWNPGAGAPVYRDRYKDRTLLSKTA